MPEALVIAQEPSDALWSRVTQFVQLTQRLPPRLAIVEGEARALEEVSRLSGVVVLSGGDTPDAVLEQLNPTERSFLEAWFLRRKPKPSRPGDNLAWDSEGFEPPDRPDPQKR
jgi:hypothetical protein